MAGQGASGELPGERTQDVGKCTLMVRGEQGEEGSEAAESDREQRERLLLLGAGHRQSNAHL